MALLPSYSYGLFFSFYYHSRDNLSIMFKITEQICLIRVPDENRIEGFRYIDLGNYFIDSNGKKCLVTSKQLAEKYSDLLNVPVYVHKLKD